LFEECREAAILTFEGHVLDVNQAGLDLFGYERKEIIGMDAARVLYSSSDDLSRLQSEMERCGSVKDYAMQFRRKDGKPIDCVVTASGWQDKDGMTGYMAVVRDTTAQKDTEHSLRTLLRM